MRWQVCGDETQREKKLMLCVRQFEVCLRVCLPGLIAAVVCSSLGRVGVTVSCTVVVSANRNKNADG